MEIKVTQVTFLSSGLALIGGPIVSDATKVVIASAPLEVAETVARLLSDGRGDVFATPPDEDILEIREL